MSSVPGLGMFTATRDWDTLRSALMKAKIQQIPITLLTGSQQSRIERMKLQFEAAYSNWNQWLEQDDNARKLVEFCTYFGLVVPATERPAWLESQLIRINNEILDSVYNGGRCEVIVTDEFLPVLAWIADSRMAVFAFSSQSGMFPGFHTQDSNIIQSLEGFIKRGIKAATVRPTA